MTRLFKAILGGLARSRRTVKLLSNAALEAQKQRSANKLLRLRPYQDKARQIPNLQHRAAEWQYNKLAKQQHTRAGKPAASYVYQRDARSDDVTRTQRLRGGRYRLRTVEGPVHDPATVINFRKTKPGGRLDARVRRTTAKLPGDDAGHLRSVSAGANPAARRNVSAQNAVQNRAGGTWFRMEQRLKAMAARSQVALKKVAGGPPVQAASRTPSARARPEGVIGPRTARSAARRPAAMRELAAQAAASRQGTGMRVKYQEVTRRGEKRPIARQVTLTDARGRKVHQELFVNPRNLGRVPKVNQVKPPTPRKAAPRPTLRRIK
jgi:hypothetical protein